MSLLIVSLPIGLPNAAFANSEQPLFKQDQYNSDENNVTIPEISSVSEATYVSDSNGVNMGLAAVQPAVGPASMVLDSAWEVENPTAGKLVVNADGSITITTEGGAINDAGE